MVTTKLRPAIKFGPGYFIKEQMEYRHWTQEELAEIMGVTVKHINKILNDKQPISLVGEKLLQTPLIIPDTLTLTEALAGFKGSREDFAVILNEYALVVGLITLNDIMNTLMGDLVNHDQEEQIIRRDDHSWLIDGITPIDDVMRSLEIEMFPEYENYETIAGFMMYMLRKIPKRTDSVTYAGYKFEVVDIDSYKIDQLLVTRISSIDKTNPATITDKKTSA